MHLYTSINKKIHFEDICKRFNLSPDCGQDIVNFLVSKGLVIEEDGVYKHGKVSTHLTKRSTNITKHHTNWRLKAIQTAERLKDEEMLYSANFSIHKDDFIKIKYELLETIKKFLTIAEKSSGDELAQFNIDLFWID